MRSSMAGGTSRSQLATGRGGTAKQVLGEHHWGMVCPDDSVPSASNVVDDFPFSQHSGINVAGRRGWNRGDLCKGKGMLKQYSRKSGGPELPWSNPLFVTLY